MRKYVCMYLFMCTCIKVLRVASDTMYDDRWAHTRRLTAASRTGLFCLAMRLLA